MAAAVCYGVRGGGAQLCSTLWDGLPSHRSRAMRDLLHTQCHWLVVERLPAYAPNLNPVEGLWSSLKAVELANLTAPTLREVIDQAHRGVERVRRTPYLAPRSCAGLACRSHDHQPDTQDPVRLAPGLPTCQRLARRGPISAARPSRCRPDR